MGSALLSQWMEGPEAITVVDPAGSDVPDGVALIADRAEIADRLVETVINWARTEGFRRVVLEVANENAAAIALYRRLGFERTGATATLPAPRTHVTEHERALEL